MTIGEKIQACRKSNGLSQEELASTLGVSRQALSKWECNTSVPDIDKIVGLSNYFGVSTDYLLKDDISDEKVDLSTETKKQSGYIPVAVSTAIIAIGLVLALALANDGTLMMYWSFRFAAWGLGVQIVGIAVFEVLYFSKHFEIKSQTFFWAVNTWLLSVMPVIFGSGFLVKFLNGMESLRYYLNIALFYFIINSALTLMLFMLSKRRSKTK